MSKISAHVLDTALGRPAADLSIQLDLVLASGELQRVGGARTNSDGRVADLLAGRPLEARTYRVVFETGPYFERQQQPLFYPRVEVIFQVAAAHEQHHIPLLLSPYGYSTYRGS